MADERRNDEHAEAPGAKPSGSSLDRRRFLNNSWKVLGVALVAEAGWTTYDILKPGAAVGFGGVVDAGPVSNFAADGSVTYSLNGRFYVTQYQGGLRALYQKCPHLGCKVPWVPGTGEFKCPCHGSVYNLIGEYESGPAPRGMDRFPISIQNDHVMVDTSTIVEGPPPGTHDGPPVGSPSSATSSTGGTTAEAGPASGPQVTA
jgi:cytochrome b6-f complex iron-sulfur subunit